MTHLHNIMRLYWSAYFNIKGAVARRAEAYTMRAHNGIDKWSRNVLYASA